MLEQVVLADQQVKLEMVVLVVLVVLEVVMVKLEVQVKTALLELAQQQVAQVEVMMVQ